MKKTQLNILIKNIITEIVTSLQQQKKHRCEKCWNERNIPPQDVPNAEIQVFGKWLCRGCYEDWLRQHPQAINENYHYLHKEYRLYEGNKHITAIFEDNSKLALEVHFHNNHGEDKDKWRRKAFTTWKSVANELHGDVQLSEVGNPIQKSWKECFKEALKHPKMKDYIRRNDQQPIFDPVNFTRVG
jgi:hypothetical protein